MKILGKYNDCNHPNTYISRFLNTSTNQEIVHKDSFLDNYENILRKKEGRLTRISICIVWLFIICHVWKLIPTVYELLYSEVDFL